MNGEDIFVSEKNKKLLVSATQFITAQLCTAIPYLPVRVELVITQTSSLVLWHSLARRSRPRVVSRIMSPSGCQRNNFW